MRGHTRRFDTTVEPVLVTTIVQMSTCMAGPPPQRHGLSREVCTIIGSQMAPLYTNTVSAMHQLYSNHGSPAPDGSTLSCIVIPIRVTIQSIQVSRELNMVEA